MTVNNINYIEFALSEVALYLHLARGHECIAVTKQKCFDILPDRLEFRGFLLTSLGKDNVTRAYSQYPENPSFAV